MSLKSHFHQLARSITVSDIYTPFLTSFENNKFASDVSDEWVMDLCGEKDLDPNEQISLVTQKNKVIGWIGFDMLEHGKTIRECMDTITPESIMSSDTSLFDAINAFANGSSHFYLVLHGNQFIGWLSYQNMHKPPLRLCLFSILINIEKMLLEILLKNPQEAINCLPEGRIEQVKNNYKLRNNKSKENKEYYNSKLLEYTNLEDKFYIAQQTKSLCQKMTLLQDDNLCKLARKLRNEVAHPVIKEHSSKLLSRDKLWPFIQWADKLELQLHNYLLENSKN